jgi:hypothetical protein
MSSLVDWILFMERVDGQVGIKAVRTRFDFWPYDYGRGNGWPGLPIWFAGVRFWHRFRYCAMDTRIV